MSGLGALSGVREDRVQGTEMLKLTKQSSFRSILKGAPLAGGLSATMQKINLSSFVHLVRLYDLCRWVVLKGMIR